MLSRFTLHYGWRGGGIRPLNVNGTRSGAAGQGAGLIRDESLALPALHCILMHGQGSEQKHATYASLGDE